MPTRTITLTPGVMSELTPSLNQSAFQTTNLIRFAPSGLPQKLGGWSKFYPNAIGSPVTALHAWEDLSGVLHLAVGATLQLGVITNGAFSDITPQTNVTNPPPMFSATAGSDVITVYDANSQTTIYDVVVFTTQVSVGGIILFGAYAITLSQDLDQYQIEAQSIAPYTTDSGGTVAAFTTVLGLSLVNVNLAYHGLSVGSTYAINFPVSVGGISLSGFYSVTSVTDISNFSITATEVATSAETVEQNNGDANLLYYITPAPNISGEGYGDGGYGEGAYGEGVTPSQFTGTPITATDWTFDNFGGALAACPNNGPIFIWTTQSGFYTAQIIANAPLANTGIFVSMSAEIVVAYGSSVLGIQDPLLINWCSAGNFNDWTATVANLAGSFRLPKGSRIVGGLQGPQYGLIWTDIDLWSMNFIGLPDVFGFTEIATGCGLASKFAAGVLGTTVYWLSFTAATSGAQTSGGQFYALPSGGSVTPVPCSVWDFIFQNIDVAHVAKIRCGVNSQFGEVAWFFPVVGGSGKNTAYVKFTPQYSCWDVGYLGRSAWIDQSVFGPAIGADAATNIIYQHEVSNDADGQAMGEFFTTGYWAMSDGQDVMACDLVYPDMRYGQLGSAQTASVDLSFNYTNYADGAPIYATPSYAMTNSGPPYLNPRFRARLMSMTCGNSTVGSFWRLGGLRTRTAPDGRL